MTIKKKNVLCGANGSTVERWEGLSGIFLIFGLNFKGTVL